MKRFSILLSILMILSTLAVGQNGFTPTIPDQPVHLHTTGSYAQVQGHWVSITDDKKFTLPGPSISDILCYQKVCHEKQANIILMGDTFTMNTDYIDYGVERWTNKEIVASTIDGICRVRNVIKFDLVQKRVYWMQTLSEPTNDLPQLQRIS